MSSQRDLPIWSVLPDLQDTLAREQTVILQADPGAGKSTVVPLELRNASWLGDKKILLLQPRRLAARAVAQRMADTLGEKVGATVGYRMRLDRRIGPATRIEVVTEGMLTRQLQHDPLLEDIGCIIFDEFHERSLQADLGLALSRDIQQALREDLRILLMSATLDTQALSSLLDNAPVICSEGRQYPVATRYIAGRGAPPSNARIAQIIVDALQSHPGNLLVFLPGIREIRSVATQLKGVADEQLIVAPLHGGLRLDQQALAIEQPPAGKRKVVLSTSIAETSLTIEGISTVIDVGLERRAQMNPRTGMTGLVTVPASRASSDQRRGRAGRLGPGHCIRLWSEADHEQRPANSEPEIVLADLSPLALEVIRWGITDPAQLCWLTPPPPQPWQQALRLLRSLEIIDHKTRLTAHGEAVAALGLHPRIGHMLIIAKQRGNGRRACDIAAFMEERSPFRGSNQNENFAARLQLFDSHPGNSGVDHQILRRVKRQSRALQQQLGASADSGTSLSIGAICALAYPDRIGQRRAGTRPAYRLSGGGAAYFPEPNPISDESYLVITELDGREREARIFSAVPVTIDALELLFEQQIVTNTEQTWDDKREAVIAQKIVRLGELILHRKPAESIDTATAKDLLLTAIKRAGIDCLPWTDAAKNWCQRVQFLASLDTLPLSLPDYSEQALLDSLDEWLGPGIEGISSFTALQRLDLFAILKNRLDWEQQQKIEELAPTHLQVPSGSRIRLSYSAGKPPVLAVRIQEMFSATTTPRIADGRAAVLLHLLSPARRPVQITDDIARFWAGSYQEVRKEMKSRYPKHHWPEDPINTQPHKGVRPA